MAVTDIQGRIQRIFSEHMNVEVPSEDADLFESAVLDSLTFVELLVKLEEEFGRKISLEEIEMSNFQSVARIAEFVSRDGQMK